MWQERTEKAKWSQILPHSPMLLSYMCNENYYYLVILLSNNNINTFNDNNINTFNY